MDPAMTRPVPGVAGRATTFVKSPDAHFLTIDPRLSFWKQPRLLRGVFGILLISALMSLFEIGFYMIIVRPETERQIDALLNQFPADGLEFSGVQAQTQAVDLPGIGSDGVKFSSPEELFPLVQDAFLPEASGPQDMMAATIKAIAVEERIKMDRINMYAFLSMGGVVLLLFAVMWGLYEKLEWEAWNVHYVRVFGGEMSVTVASSIMAVMMLAGFQYLFYLFGLKFKYTGTNGLDELRLELLDGIRSELGLPSVASVAASR